jgi:plasmid maintenance system antidote protein VapI
VFSQADPVPTAPPQHVDVEAILVGGTIVVLPTLLAGRSASDIARQSGVPRSTVQRIQAGQTRTSAATAVALLRVVDQETAMALESELVDAECRYRQYLAPIVEQIARGGPVRAWAADRQLLAKLRRRLARLEAEQKSRPRPDTDAQLELVRSRIADLEDRDDLPPSDPHLERAAMEILNSRQKGVPQLRRAGLHPGGAERRKDELAAGLGLRDEEDVRLIDTGRLYKLRQLATQSRLNVEALDE